MDYKIKTYCCDKKMLPFFTLEDIQSYLEQYFSKLDVSIVKIKPESMDSSYRLNDDSFIALYKDQRGNLRFIDQDGSAFLFSGRDNKTDEYTQEHFILC